MTTDKNTTTIDTTQTWKVLSGGVRLKVVDPTDPTRTKLIKPVTDRDAEYYSTISEGEELKLKQDNQGRLYVPGRIKERGPSLNVYAAHGAKKEIDSRLDLLVYAVRGAADRGLEITASDLTSIVNATMISVSRGKVYHLVSPSERTEDGELAG